MSSSTVESNEMMKDTRHHPAPREILDDDDDADFTFCITAPPTPDALRQGSGSLSPTPPAEADGTAETTETDTEDLRYTVVWDSSKPRTTNVDPTKHTTPSAAKGVSESEEDRKLVFNNKEAMALKDAGNALYKSGDFDAALRLYHQAAETCLQHPLNANSSNLKQPKDLDQDQASLLAILHSNIAAVYFKQHRLAAAATAAQQAHRLNPTWAKPLHWLAQSRLELGDFVGAVAACKVGEKLVGRNSEGLTEFSGLLGRVAVAGAKQGDLAGYDGLHLEVQLFLFLFVLLGFLKLISYEC